MARQGVWDVEGEKRVQKMAQNEKTVNDKWRESEFWRAREIV